ncbi:TraR/DksA C4-type zinc finger protein [Shewanella sp. SR44-3]|uniref:TraR/DksA C4-type zinc finger protein n=1 Tax=unclassified Shewanella TaxID=196818 RepID=UPI0015FBD4F5|nr:TraR/DksA C4-type zinc finger protein [Shewanella sp. SR44-3]MBB1271038.1 TraR/DksA family transcriptional regulator [Shewanella sp. SR44-3]
MSNQHILSTLLQLEASLKNEFTQLALSAPTVTQISLTQPPLTQTQFTQASIDSASLSVLIEWMTHQDLSHHGLFRRLMRLDAAYCQLELGLYGLCADCETEIEVLRLNQDPTEQRCSSCEAKFNRQHRQELRLDH